MPAEVIQLRRTETVRTSLLRMGAAGRPIQAALATWFDLLHKRSAEDLDADIRAMPDLVNERSIVFPRNETGAAIDEPVLVGGELTGLHRGVAVETVRTVSLATPIAFTHEWGADEAVHSLVLPFGRPHRAVVVLFDW